MTTEYQPDHVESSIAGWTAALLVIFIGVAALMAIWLYHGHIGDVNQTKEAATYEAPPEPRLLVNEVDPRKAYLSEQQLQLGSYGWVNRSEGVVRVPVERAMELLESQSNAAHGSAERQGQ